MNKITACALALVGTLALAGPVEAKPKPKSGTFKLEIKGEQLTTWNYIKDQAPSCDWPENEEGHQYLTFGTYDFGDTAKPKVVVKPVAGGGVALKFVRKDITLMADATLERNYRRMFSQQSDCPGGGPYGGGDPVPDAIGTAKCRTTGELDLYTGSSIGEVENPSYPTGIEESDAPKAPFYFAGDPYWSTGSDPSLPALCYELGQPDADMGLTETQGEWAGAVVPAGGSLPAKKLLDPTRKRTKVEFGRTVTYPNAIQSWGGPPSTTGKTRMDVTFTFTRVSR